MNTYPETITPAEASAALSNGAHLIDVREPVEFAESRIPGATLIPLGSIEAHTAELGCTRPVIITCQGGKRGAQATEKLRALGFTNVRNLAGGLNAWKAAGLPCESDAKPPIPLMRQVQMVVGLFVLTGSLLTVFVDPRWVYLTMFFGAGLIFTGSTGFCGLALILARMPWNRRPAGSAASRSGSPSCCQ